jgi:hypothetical protein
MTPRFELVGFDAEEDPVFYDRLLDQHLVTWHHQKEVVLAWTCRWDGKNARDLQGATTEAIKAVTPFVQILTISRT